VFRILVKIIPSPWHKLVQSILKDKNIFLSKEKNNRLKPRYNQPVKTKFQQIEILQTVSITLFDWPP